MLSRKNRLLLYCSIVLLLYCLGGCGYTTKTVLPDNVKTIHVAIFKNNIDITKEVSAKDKYEVYRPNLEVDMRDAIVNRIFLDGNLKVSHAGSADAALEGEILQYRKDPLRYQNEVVQEYRISLVCDIKLISKKDSKVLLEEQNITGDATYFTTGTLQKTETSAMSDAMSDLARRIVNKIVENW
ncbi:MAG: LPS assembly lipoprotein LptE [Candidatus Omnitrophota bacterium]|nr:LPS assembly lipoprotein LptE [Candidatus Omnitrophota bacterium]